MLNFIRSFVFDFFFYTGSILSFLVVFPCLLFPEKCFLWFDRYWSGLVMLLGRYIIGWRYDIRGLENLPQSPYLIASLHQSAWDIFIFATFCKNPVYVCKRELFYIPLLGSVMKKFQMISVDRKKGPQALKDMLKAAKAIQQTNQRPIVIFPEGTRSQPGEIKPFQIGIGMLYQHLQCPVVPVVLNSGCVWGRRHVLKKPGTIQLTILPAIQPGLSRDEFMITLQTQMHASAQTMES